jgi:hypothetical protein
MSVEQHLREALHRADDYAPSPDLFARVQRSIEEARAHRRRVRAAVGAGSLGLATVVGYLAILAEVSEGRLSWPWWSLELLTTVLLVVAVVVLGPLIRRFGRIYVTTVFRANPPTATRFLSLLDVAYYLAFSSFVLMTATIEPYPSWLEQHGTAEVLTHQVARMGGLALLMGLLHSLTIVVLPILGLVFADGWRRLTPDQRG